MFVLLKIQKAEIQLLQFIIYQNSKNNIIKF